MLKPQYAILRFAKYKGPEIGHIEAHNERTKERYAIIQVYGKSPEQIFLQAETYAELHDGLRQISARERTYLLYRYGFTDGDEHPIPETAAHFHLTEKRAKKTERAALDDLRRRLPH